MQSSRRASIIVALALFVGCSSGGGPRPTASGPTPDARTTSNPNAGPTPLLAAAWPTRSREHVDLWLHAYAMLAPDTTLVPYFRRGYRDQMLARRRQRGITTQLDANRDALLRRIAVSPALATNGQFLPLYFESWDQMRQAIDLFMRAQGNPGATNDPNGRAWIALLAAAFPVGADREWLRLFVEGADDESRKFYHDEWTSEQRARASVVSHVDSAWQRSWRPPLQRFLNNTQQQNGELYLSLPLGGEGRTIKFGKQQNAIAVPFPATRDQSDEVLYVMAHESVGAVASAAIEDNTTPAERRTGTTSRYEQAAAVRAGALLLERTIPAAVPGYMRFYLQQAGRPAPTEARAAFLAAFPLPDTVRDALTRQLEVILGGI
jgi:hypothetical protein